MLKRGHRRYGLLLGLLPLVAVGVALLGTSSATSKTNGLHGFMLDISNFGGPGCPSVTGVCSKFNAIGDINGDGVVSIDTLPTTEALSHSNAHTVIHTKKGDLTCNEAAIFDLFHADHAFVDLCLISGGTGIYAGATGYIQENGTFDFASNLGQLEYSGKLVLADNPGAGGGD